MNGLSVPALSSGFVRGTTSTSAKGGGGEGSSFCGFMLGGKGQYRNIYERREGGGGLQAVVGR
jgi:hypothetical protein